MRVIVLALIAASAAGCSARRQASEAAPVVVQSTGAEDPLAADRMMVLQDHEQIVGFDAQIDELSARGDCGTACQAGEQMCGLGERICEISGRHPGDPEITDRCADARTRCDRARERLAEACQCPPTNSME